MCPIAPQALGKTKTIGEKTMMNLVLKSLNRLHKDEAGQGLVEYLLILALVAFGAVAGMGNLATGLNSAFQMIANILGVYIT